MALDMEMVSEPLGPIKELPGKPRGLEGAKSSPPGESPLLTSLAALYGDVWIPCARAEVNTMGINKNDNAKRRPEWHLWVRTHVNLPNQPQKVVRHL